MLKSTLSRVRCPAPRCSESTLQLKATEEKNGDVLAGHVQCSSCRGKYPILAGVLVLVPRVADYLMEHAKGISRHVRDEAIPAELRDDFVEARKEAEEQSAAEHYEEDLEAERVTSLYVMNHFLSAKGDWWKSRSGDASPFLEEVILKYWDQGPMARIRDGVQNAESLVELGCGSGGLARALSGRVREYLGLDSSFASIALARHLVLGAPLEKSRVRIPEDLLNGPVSRDLPFKAGAPISGADFIVCDITEPPLREGDWQMSAALNVIDMLDNPADLADLQARLVRKGGTAIQSCPYIWHPEVAKRLRKALPKDIADSASAVSSLYEKAGLKVEKSHAHVPWLFFKHVRQMEMYSVHLFFAKKY